MTEREEHDLISRVLSGDEHAYRGLVDHYKRYAFTIALKILDNRAEAEEAAQDAFIKAFQHLRSFQRQSRFSTWLYRIVFNTAISYQRKRKAIYHDIEKQILLHPQETGHELEREDEQGANPMHHLFDEAALAALNNGSEAVSYDEVNG